MRHRFGQHLPAPRPLSLTGFFTTGNPPINYADIEGEGGVWSATHKSKECLQNDIYAGPEDAPMGNFDKALASGDVPAFNLVLPNGWRTARATATDQQSLSAVRRLPGP